MFEDNRYIEQDEMFRSILEEGQEPVPAHVWDGIEADLDRIAHRRLVVMRIRRTAVGIAAAAALAVGLFFSHNEDGDIISPAGHDDMIAVVEPQKDVTESMQDQAQTEDVTTVTSQAPRLIAAAPAQKIQIQETSVISETPAIDAYETVPVKTEETSAEDKTLNYDVTVQESKTESKSTKTQRTYTTKLIDQWPEDEEETSRSRVRAVTLSGLTGTNSPQNNSRVNPMRSPAHSSAPKKAGIKETGSNGTYGVPVSFGIGAKFGIAKKWSIGTGINYTLLSRQFQGTYTSADGKETDKMSIREIQHYVGIPVNVYYDIVSKKNINFYTYAGGTMEKCVSDKFQVLDTDITHNEKVKGLQLSANIGMGVEFMLGKHLGIYVDPSLRYYFNNNQPRSIRTVQPLMFGLEMGLRMNL